MYLAHPRKLQALSSLVILLHLSEQASLPVNIESLQRTLPLTLQDLHLPSAHRL